ncbi:MAG: FmdB family transcriptional regulator [Rubrobacter sp.]|jgi:putative FmdB family regulatory protein|nr:FmdB family transcriptional regulator [Rubrobacter sp.]
MPIYEYKCEKGHVFDVMQKMSEDSLTSCVECAAPVRKVLQPVGISFKGSGFYSTDYSKKGPKKEPAESKETASSDSGSASSGSNGSADSSTNGSSGPSEKKASESTSSKSD